MRTGIVLARLHRAICARRMKNDQVARCHRGEVAAFRKGVAALADGADNVVGHQTLARTNSFDAMISVIECGADEIIHRRVEDKKIRAAHLRVLHISHRREEHARIARNHSSRFEDELHIHIRGKALDECAISRWKRGSIFAVTVRNTEAAAEIETLDHMAVFAEGFN